MFQRVTTRARLPTKSMDVLTRSTLIAEIIKRSLLLLRLYWIIDVLDHQLHGHIG